MLNMDIIIKVENPCAVEKDFCINCHSHFMTIRPLIKNVVVSRRFFKDLKDAEKVKSIVKDVLECSSINFNELHKFEENVNGNLVFRAKRDNIHVVYCVDKRRQIIFLRAFRNYSEYAKFLEDKKEIERMIPHA